jgi:transposase
MAWKETHVMDERLMFIAEWQAGMKTMAELCREYEVSRKTGYKLINRYAAEGVDGLKDRSHAAHHHPQAVSEAIAAAVVGLRAEPPSWGPKKLKALLERDEPQENWPAESTIGVILDRHGLVRRQTTCGGSTSKAGSAPRTATVAIP